MAVAGRLSDHRAVVVVTAAGAVAAVVVADVALTWVELMIFTLATRVSTRDLIIEGVLSVEDLAADPAATPSASVSWKARDARCPPARYPVQVGTDGGLTFHGTRYTASRLCEAVVSSADR
jgi:hypothetical protein